MARHAVTLDGEESIGLDLRLAIPVAVSDILAKLHDHAANTWSVISVREGVGVERAHAALHVELAADDIYVSRPNKRRLGHWRLEHDLGAKTPVVGQWPRQAIIPADVLGAGHLYCERRQANMVRRLHRAGFTASHLPTAACQRQAVSSVASLAGHGAGFGQACH